MTFTKYPITDYNNLNLDWMVKKIGENRDDIDLTAAGLTSEATARQEQDALLSARIDALDPQNVEHVLFIGDSYAVTSVVGTATWATTAAECLGLTIGTNAFIRSQGSVGFLNRVTETNNFRTLMESATVADPAKIGAIIVCGGANDKGGTEAAILSRIEDFMASAAEHYPNAKVYIGMIGNFAAGYSEDRRIVEKAYKECGRYGAIYLNGVEHINHVYNQFIDEVHPTPAMCLEMGRGIAQAYRAGSVYVSRRSDNEVTVTPSGISKELRNFRVEANQEGGMIRLDFYSSSYYTDMLTVVCDPMTVGFIGQYEIGTLSGPNLAVCRDLPSSGANCRCEVADNQVGAAGSGTAYVGIGRNKLYLSFYGQASSGHHAPTFNNVVRFYLSNFSIWIPASIS